MKRQLLNFQNKIFKKGFNLFACGPIDRDFPGSKGMMILGNGGPTFWDFFKEGSKGQSIDDFVKDYIESSLIEVGFKADDFHQAYPSGDSTPPLLEISRNFNLSRPSQLGLDLSSTYGPWFGIRALFFFKRALPLISPKPFESPCHQCLLRPCLKSCPGDAFKNEKFSISDCVDFRLKKGSTCEEKCDARLACPVGKEYQYSKEQMTYHYKHGLKMIKKIGH